MPTRNRAPSVPAFDTFGELLKFLRRRAQITQKALSIAVGYSEAQISRLEQNQRLPDLATVAALFVPALDVDSQTAARLLDLAAQARGASVTLTHAITRETIETFEEEGAAAPRVSLPLTSFVGREQELRALERLLSSPAGPGRETPRGTRLVTLTGAGGAGKTRLALELAARWEAGRREDVALVDLAPLSDPAHLPQAVASGLGVRGGGDLTARLLHALRPRRLLMVLDNCEHLLDAAADFAAAVLAACPQVQLLATSREALRIAGETTYPVPPLAAAEAERLFLARARQAQPGLDLTADTAPVIAHLCHRLDGLPLAIELAAARLSVLTLPDIAARLDTALDSLIGHARGAPARHQTLRATIAWSEQLLSDEERTLLRRLAVFAGGFEGRAVLQVALGQTDAPTEAAPFRLPEALERLISKSLVVAGATGRVTRYRLLETIRQYALEGLRASGEADALGRAHFAYFAELAAEGEARFRGPEHQAALERLEAEHDNLRAALQWALVHDGPAGLQLVLRLWHFWWVRGYAERLAWLGRFLALSGLEAHSPVVAVARAVQAAHTQAPSQAAAQLADSRAACLAAGDRAAYVTVLITEGNAWWWHDYPRARACFEAAVAEGLEQGDLWTAGRAHVELGELIQTRGEDRAAARRHCELGAQLFRQCGDRHGLASALAHLGDVALEQSDLPMAEACAIEALAIAREFGDRETQAWALNDLGVVAFGRGDLARAIDLHAASLRLDREIGHAMHAAIRQYWLGLTQVYAEQFAAAIPGLEANLGLGRAEGFDWAVAASLYGLGEAARRQGKHQAAHTYFLDALAAFADIDYRWGICSVIDGLAALAVTHAQAHRAAQLLGAADALRQAIGVVLLPIERVAHDRWGLEARQMLGEAGYRAAYAAGHATSFTGALAVARDGL